MRVQFRKTMHGPLHIVGRQSVALTDNHALQLSYTGQAAGIFGKSACLRNG